MHVLNLVPQGPLPYQQVWDLQREIHGKVAAGTCPPTLICVEHCSVYTAGARTSATDRAAAAGVEVLKVDRGGRITWHGPGQLVCYPILALRLPLDVVKHVRLLEAAVMETCAHYGIHTQRVPGRSGVWVSADANGDARKICAVGCRVSRGTSMHGIGLNCCPDLSAFTRISPCGINDAEVTSLTLERSYHGESSPLRPAQVLPILTAAICKHLASEVRPHDLPDLSNEIAVQKVTL